LTAGLLIQFKHSHAKLLSSSIYSLAKLIVGSNRSQQDAYRDIVLDGALGQKLGRAAVIADHVSLRALGDEGHEGEGAHAARSASRCTRRRTLERNSAATGRLTRARCAISEIQSGPTPAEPLKARQLPVSVFNTRHSFNWRG
jgi:hypothetical protein